MSWLVLYHALMDSRPTMTLPHTSREFLERYWLKAELFALCKAHGLPTAGAKGDLLRYIACHIDGLPVVPSHSRKRKTRSSVRDITLDSIIEDSYSSDERHRRFFKSVMGPGFSFNVQFMGWMHEHKGEKTYREAIAEWARIREEKRAGRKRSIAPQFEYNRYTRDFFERNPGRTREECIRCWKHKKAQTGSHAYDDADLAALGRG